jgi:hypothetical protein
VIFGSFLTVAAALVALRPLEATVSPSIPHG